MPSSPKILLVIPCYRESERLPRFLPHLCQALEEASLPVEVLVVDDGSGAEEQAALEAVVEPLRVTYPRLRPVLKRPVNLGKGAAVYRGWDQAQGEEWLAFVDADGAVPPEEVVRVLRKALEPEQAGRALYGVRTGGQGTVVKRQAVRRVTGQVFRALVHFFFDIGVPDTQCGLKVVPARVYQLIKPELREFRFCFDVELTCLLQRERTPITSVPINWEESPGSRVRPATVREMFLSLLRLRHRFRE